MGQSLQIEPDQVRLLVAELADIADASQQDLVRLQAALDREGECWGDDEPGRIFAKSYVPQAKNVLAGDRNLIENLRGLGRVVNDIDTAFQHADAEGGREIRRAGQSPGVSASDQSGRTTPLSTTSSQGSADALLNNVGTQHISPGQSGWNPQNVDAIPHSRDVDTPAHQATQNQPQTNAGAGAPVLPGGSISPGSKSTASPNSTTPQSVQPKAPGVVAGTPSPNPPVTRRPDHASATGPRGNSAANTPWSSKAAPKNAGTASPGGRPAAAPRPGLVQAPAVGPAPVQPPPAGQRAPVGKTDGRDHAVLGAPQARNPRKNSKPTVAEPIASDGAMALVIALAQRHGLRLHGFPECGIGEAAAAVLVEVVERTLLAYPFLPLAGIAVLNATDTAAQSDWQTESRGDWIMIDQRAVQQSHEYPESLCAVLISDLGRIMVQAAPERLKPAVQRHLIAEYGRRTGPWGGRETLAQVIDGYRQWRAALVGNPVHFDAERALVSAFVEVEFYGAAASEPATVLHRVLVDGARDLAEAR